MSDTINEGDTVSLPFVPEPFLNRLTETADNTIQLPKTDSMIENAHDIEEFNENVVNSIVCPISLIPPRFPVLADDGYIYDESEIKQYLQKNSKSPINRNPLSNNLRPIAKFKKIIEILGKTNSTINELLQEDTDWVNNIDLVFRYLNNGLYTELLKYKNIKINSSFENSTFVVRLLEVCKNTTVIRELFDKCIDFNFKSQTGHNVLHYIVRKCEDIGLIDYAISKNIDINAVDVNGYTPLHWACRSSNLEIINYLYSKTTDPDTKYDNNGDLPVHLIFKNSTKESATQFLTKYKNVPNKSGDKPIHMIFKRDLTSTSEVYEWLEVFKDNLEEEDSNKQRLIHYFCHRFNIECIEKLISMGVDIKCKDNTGCLPIHIIFGGSRGYTPTHYIKLLDIFKDSLNEENNNKDTIINIICRKGWDNKILEHLLTYNVDVNHIDKDGLRPLDILIQNTEPCGCGNCSHYTDHIKLLINKGAVIDQPNGAGFDTMHMICKNTHFKSDDFKEFVNKYPNPEKETEHGWRLIHFVCRYRKYEDIVWFLTEKTVVLMAVTKKVSHSDAEFCAMQLLETNKNLTSHQREELSELIIEKAYA